MKMIYLLEKCALLKLSIGEEDLRGGTENQFIKTAKREAPQPPSQPGHPNCCLRNVLGEAKAIR